MLVLDGVRSDWVGEAIGDDRLQAEACRLLALAGTSTCVRPHDRSVLLEAGLSAGDIAGIDWLAQQHGPREAGSDWLIGPEREVIVLHLHKAGAVPTAENIARLRRATLFVLSDLLRSHIRRYQAAPDHYALIATRACDPQGPTINELSVDERPQHVAQPMVAPASNTPAKEPARPPRRRRHCSWVWWTCSSVPKPKPKASNGMARPPGSTGPLPSFSSRTRNQPAPRP